MREKIGLEHGLADMIRIMSQGNPGALNILIDLSKKPSGLFPVVLDLDDMNIRGSSIYVAFIEWAASDMDKLIKGARDRDQGLVDCVNKNGGKAVRNGASFEKEN